jgi:NADPH:quinone reductase-like Zn-dependent oxidoreductase
VPTAWNLLVHVAALKAGETVLVMGAGGNLGTIGIQIAKTFLARVSSPQPAPTSALRSAENLAPISASIT